MVQKALFRYFGKLGGLDETWQKNEGEKGNFCLFCEIASMAKRYGRELRFSDFYWEIKAPFWSLSFYVTYFHESARIRASKFSTRNKLTEGIAGVKLQFLPSTYTQF